MSPLRSSPAMALALGIGMLLPAPALAQAGQADAPTEIICLTSIPAAVACAAALVLADRIGWRLLAAPLPGGPPPRRPSSRTTASPPRNRA